MGENIDANERARILAVPSTSPTVTLAVILVHPAVSFELYIERLRALISAAVDISRTVNFDEDSTVAIDSLPEWFRNMSDVIAGEGASSYSNAGLGDPWDPEEWIYCFDPDLRAWAWCYVTVREDGVAVWVDTLGESHVPHDELLWALYVSGAESVDPLYMEDATVWENESH
ncbi:hypothetical protein ACFWU5_09335 [Nocardia sp. NPDC058640]|uniref:hypothetical protein n=1 Tax=Nocardia sp. NPDC058640 TaxID=3346571 RepID=UPI00365AE47B